MFHIVPKARCSDFPFWYLPPAERPAWLPIGKDKRGCQRRLMKCAVHLDRCWLGWLCYLPDKWEVIDRPVFDSLFCKKITAASCTSSLNSPCVGLFAILCISERIQFMLSSEKRGARQVIIQYFHMSSFSCGLKTLWIKGTRADWCKADLKLYELKGQGLIGVKRAPAKYHQQQANYSPVSTPKERVISAQSHCQ